jgi:hypothetical protein
MKTLLTSALVALALTVSVAPAYAGMHCYILNGKTVCCNTVGMFTTCN